MVLEVLADRRQIFDHVDPQAAQFAGVTDPRELQQLRGVDRATAEDDLAGTHPLGPAGQPLRLHADGPLALEHDPRDELMAADLKVRSLLHGVQIRTGGAPSPAVVDVAVKRRESLLAVPVHIVGQRIPGFLDRLEKRLEQRACRRTPLEDQRPVSTAKVVGPALQVSIFLKYGRQWA